MCCVASAPIVPLARKLDAGFGMPRGELPFISASCPRHSPPPHSPLGLHPRFFHKVLCRFLAPPSLSRAAPAFFPQGALPLRLSAGSLRAFPHLRHVPPGCTPFPPHGHRRNGTFLPKTQKNEHRSLGSGARFGLLSGRKRPVFLMFQKPQPKKTERTSCAKRMRMNMARG